jgi:hypothetical protein
VANATRYTVRIRVRGELARTWSPVLAGLDVAAAADGTTLVSGELVDQAALHGLLGSVRDLGLTVLSVESHAVTQSSSRSRADMPTP